MTLYGPTCALRGGSCAKTGHTVGGTLLGNLSFYVTEMLAHYKSTGFDITVTLLSATLKFFSRHLSAIALLHKTLHRLCRQLLLDSVCNQFVILLLRACFQHHLTWHYLMLTKVNNDLPQIRYEKTIWKRGAVYFGLHTENDRHP